MSAPSRPEILSPAFLSSLRHHPTLPADCWYFISAVTLSFLNRPDEIPKILMYALDHGVRGPDSKPDHDEQLRIARKLREGLVKGGNVFGTPKTINSLLTLKNATPPSLLDKPGEYSPTSRRSEMYETPSSQILQRGRQFFEELYGDVTDRVIGNLYNSGTEDLALVAMLGYSYIMSNTSILSPVETSFALIAGLVPQDVNPQLKGHLKGAVNNGAAVEEVRAVRDIVIKVCEAAGMTFYGNQVAGGWGWSGEIANL